MALDKVATPPAIDKAKSLASKEPLPLAVLNTNSSRFTTTVALLLARVTLVKVGGTWSDPRISNVLIYPSSPDPDNAKAKVFSSICTKELYSP